MLHLGIIDSHFPTPHVYGFVSAVLCAFVSIIFFTHKKTVPALILLFVSALIIRLTMAGIDPYLNLWDEQYHALVAKNIVEHPFTPMLIADPVLPYSYEKWTQNHIWLHKQPLFLWQIALSYEIFGINEFALRFPSAVMTALCVLMIFRIGKHLMNERIAYCGAFLFAFSNFQIEMATGSINTDHNDIAFMFYVTASIWAWAEYMNDKRKRWVLLIGLFSGMAILVKWLPGLLVFSGWGLCLLADKENRKKIAAYKDIVFAFLISMLVMLPWQIYKSIVFPAESAAEYDAYSKHFTMALDGHGGDWLFHFEQLGWLYSKAGAFLIVPGLLLLAFAMKDRKAKIAYFTFILLLYLFFTLAATKMPLFCIPVAPLLFLALGAVLEKIIGLSFIPSRFSAAAGIVILSFTGMSYLDLNTLEELHTDRNPEPGTYRKNRIHNTQMAKEAARLLPSKEYVVFNCKRLNAILVMYYAGNTAYDWYPDQTAYEDLKRRGIKMAVFADDRLPAFLAEDPDVFKMDLWMITY